MTMNGKGESSPMPLLPSGPVVFQLKTRLVMTIREPFKTEVRQLCPGDSLRLEAGEAKPAGGRAIRVLSSRNQPVGYLAADVAAYISILLDHETGIIDDSTAAAILLAAPPGDMAARRLRYPKLTVCLRLTLPSAWRFFVIAAVLGTKTDDYAGRFNLDGNPWLAPLHDLHERYRTIGHDKFSLPAGIAEAWIQMTRHYAPAAGDQLF